jgi:uncharacterized membrane protein (UPF0127 family)
MVCERCMVADTPSRRLRGLLGRDELLPGSGLLIRPAASIHTWFMRFAIDAVFLDRDGVVLRIAERLAPYRVASQRGARAVLELAAGECARRGLHVGERLVSGSAGSEQQLGDAQVLGQGDLEIPA